MPQKSRQQSLLPIEQPQLPLQKPQIFEQRRSALHKQPQMPKFLRLLDANLRPPGFPFATRVETLAAAFSLAMNAHPSFAAARRIFAASRALVAASI
jgi:hypothetical protein